MIVLVIILAAVILLIVYKVTNKPEQIYNSVYNTVHPDGRTEEVEKIIMGNYISGHPDIDNIKESVRIILKDSILLITDPNAFTFGRIPFSSVEDILIEDSTTIEQRVTAGRVLLLGPLAWAFKKAKKHEMAFLIIKWKDKFTNETIFQFTGELAVQSANISRNKLISYLK